MNFAKYGGCAAYNERYNNRCELWVPKSGDEVTNATKNVDGNVPLLRFELGTFQILGEAVPMCSLLRIHQVNRNWSFWNNHMRWCQVPAIYGLIV